MLSGSPPNSFPAAASRLGAGAEREGGGSSSGIRALVGVQLASSTSGDAETSLFPSLPGGPLPRVPPQDLSRAPRSLDHLQAALGSSPLL